MMTGRMSTKPGPLESRVLKESYERPLFVILVSTNLPLIQKLLVLPIYIEHDDSIHKYNK